VAARLRAAFREAGRAGTPELDARLLVAHAAHVDPHILPMRDELPAGAGIVRRATGFADRRIRGEPVARILGRWEFWGLDLALGPATLVPRPDTETVVEAALGFVRRSAGAGLRILDLGTGSGAILLALLSELPAAAGVGTDISPEALAVASGNAARLGLSGRAAFTQADWTAGIGGRFDLVVSNPPYIPADDIAALDPEVRDHDPRVALDGGPDGLDAIRTILAGLRPVLAPVGAAFIEIGAGQRGAVAAIAGAAGFTASFVPDLAGIDRVAVLNAAANGRSQV
jgi:release factor glutamine methyltransferase